MMNTLLVAARDRARLKEIFQIASRFGLGVLLARFGIEAGEAPAEASPLSLPRRTRLALEALGPTFVKLGQILATRSDLLSPEWIGELEQLHSHAPTLPFDELRPALEEALGEPPETAFARVDTVPLAAASMAQVHRAALQGGREVVLKIRRPGIRPRMEADLRLIAQLASLVETASADARRIGLVAMMRQLTEAVLEELDFTSEGRNADTMRADFAPNNRVVVPEIHWAWSSETVLVMDYVDGVAPHDGASLRAAGIDPAAIASLGADIVLDMVLINGRFHGDPHPGNLLCLPGNRIALLDVGMIGHVSPRRREEFIGFVQAFDRGDPVLLADILAVWCTPGDVGRSQLVPISERLVARHGGGRFVLKPVILDFLSLMRGEGLTMPPDLLLIFKALITVDGVLGAIEPDFNLAEAIRRSSLRIAAERLSPGHWAAVLQALGWEAVKLGEDAPRLLRLAVRRLEGASADGATSHELQTAIVVAGKWIAGALLAGAIIIGGALLVS